MHQETIRFLFATSNSSFTSSSFHPKSRFLSPHYDFASLSCPRNVRFPNFSLNATLSLPLNIPRTSEVLTISPPIRPVPHQPNNLHRSQFREKMLYLESIGLDFLSLINHNPSIVSASLSDIKSTVDYMTSLGFTAIEFRRIAGMCPEIITSRVSDIVPIFTFLLREVCVSGSNLKSVINRRPRLLACSVKQRLRPTLYFLQSIGISEANKHTYLLSTSVEEKLIPRIEYFENIGFSHRDAVSMFRRFPPLFNYSVEGNFEPKFKYFVVEMGRDLKELKEFPHYFSFSLENRIKPRHQYCVEKGVCFPLPVLLKMSEAQFRDRAEVTLEEFLIQPLKNNGWYHFRGRSTSFYTLGMQRRKEGQNDCNCTLMLSSCCKVMEERLRDLSEDENNHKWLSVTKEDIKGIHYLQLQNETHLAIKAPHGTTLEVPNPD